MIETIQETKIHLSHTLWGVKVSEEQFNELVKEFKKRVEIYGEIKKGLITNLDVLKKRPQMEVVELIISTVCEVTMCPIEALTYRSRKANYSDARKMIAWYIDNYTSFGLRKVAEILGIYLGNGKPDHSTIIYYKKCADDLDFNPELKKLKEAIDIELIKRINK